MSSIFWGLRLEPGKRYSTTVDNSFHVSKAALDCSSVKNDSEIVSVMLEEGESRTSFILCNLQKAKELQSNLDLNFMSGDRVTFFCKGNGVVHLSGYIIFEDDDGLGGLGEEEEEDNENGEADVDDTSQLNGIAQKRKKGLGSKQESKKLKLEEGEDSDEDEDEDDDEDDDDDNTMDENLIGLAGSDDDEDEDDDDDEEEEVDYDESEDGEDEDVEEEESEEDEVPAKQVQLNEKQKNKGKGQQNQLSAPGSKQSTPVGDKQKTPKGQQKTPNQQQQQNQLQSGKKDKKKGDTPKQQDKGASEDTPQKLKPSTVQGGVVIKDLKLGNGPACKNGKMVTVYYTGRLKSNNKVFDSTTQGSGFKFRLGKGEVIKGWDVGLQGMKVGGKRIITCPPQMAYGQKGSPPTIPGNSTLTFEVELRSVN